MCEKRMKTNTEQFFKSFTEKYFSSSPLKQEISKALSLFLNDIEICELISFLPVFCGDYETKNGFPFFADGVYPKEFFKKLCENATRYGVSVENYAMAVYIAILCRTKSLYEKFGIPQDIFENTCSSVAAFIKTHKLLTNKTGLSNYRWCVNYLCLAVFRIGELEYQLCCDPFEDGIIPKASDFVIKIHVPEGCNFSEEARKLSYKMAYGFFSQKLCEKALCFVCDSWLLSKEHRGIFGNISDFYNDFTIVSEYADTEKDFLWRVFGTTELDNIDFLPKNTSLQRFYIQKLNDKTPFYSSSGYFIIESTEDLWKK